MFSRLRARTPPPGSCDFPSSSFSSSFSSTTTTSSPVCMGVVPVWGIWPPSQSQLAVHSSSKLCAVASCAQILPTRRTRARRGTARCIISLTQSRVVSTHTHTHTEREREREKSTHRAAMDPHTLLESFQAYSDSRRRLHVEEVEKPFDDVKESRCVCSRSLLRPRPPAWGCGVCCGTSTRQMHAHTHRSLLLACV